MGSKRPAEAEAHIQLQQLATEAMTPAIGLASLHVVQPASERLLRKSWLVHLENDVTLLRETGKRAARQGRGFLLNGCVLPLRSSKVLATYTERAASRN